MFHQCSMVAALTALARSGAARREVDSRTIASEPMGAVGNEERLTGGDGNSCLARERVGEVSKRITGGDGTTLWSHCPLALAGKDLWVGVRDGMPHS